MASFASYRPPGSLDEMRLEPVPHTLKTSLRTSEGAGMP